MMASHPGRVAILLVSFIATETGICSSSLAYFGPIAPLHVPYLPYILYLILTVPSQQQARLYFVILYLCLISVSDCTQIIINSIFNNLQLFLFYRKKSQMVIISTIALSVTANRMPLATLNCIPCRQSSTCNCYDLCLTGEDEGVNHQN